MKKTAALSHLLGKGIGDTIRYSLSDTPENEVVAGIALLESLSLRKDGVHIISCPTCSRASFDVRSFLSRVGNDLLRLGKPLTIAVMGCPVNGPGEAKKADIGITGSGKFAVIFKEGKIILKVPSESAPEAFLKEIEKL